MSDYRRRAVIASEGGGGTIAPDFSTATWAEIQAYINENGTADYAEQVGKTRSVTLSDSSEHTLRLANATGNLYELADGSGYTGMIVEFADVIDASTKMQSSGTYISPLDIVDPMGTTTLPAIQATLPQELQSILANVKVVTTKSYNDATLVSCNMKLFIPSINEILGSTGGGYASTAELNISARWANYVANDNYAYRQKYTHGGGSSDAWWLRTPVWGASSAMCCIAPNGNVSTITTSSTYRVSPCFCLAPQPFVPPIQPLKYIESTGTQYINTGASFASGFRATGSFNVLSVDPSSYQAILVGAHESASPYARNFFGSVLVPDTPAQQAFQVGEGAAYRSGNSTFSENTQYTFDFNNYSSSPVLTVNESSLSLSSVATGSGLSSLPFYIFCINFGGSTYALGASIRLYNLKLYSDSDTLAFDFIPCTLTEAVTDYWGNPQAIGAVGLWDNVSRKFFPNNGTGDFVAGDPVIPVPDFATATWGEIQTYINNYGTAGFADQVGATRSVTLTDTTTQTLRLANVTGDLYELSDGTGYTGMIVEFENCLPDLKRWAFPTASNENPLGNADPMGTTILPAVYESFPSDLKSIIPTVKVFSAKGGAEYDTTLVYSDMKVFLPSIVEVGFSTYAPATEAATLSLWEYYRVHSTNADRKKQYSGGYIAWWSRSPAIRYSSSTDVFVVSTSGDLYREPSSNARGCSPCFCLAKQPPTPTSFADDDWETIQYAIDHDLASSVYSVGDTKSITLSDNSTHTLRIANMDGNLYELSDGTGYTGFIVEFADCFSYSAFQNTASNVGALGSINPMGTTTLPAIKALLPQGLQDILATVKVLKSNSGTDGTLVSSDMDLFLPALKEVYGGNDSTPEEQAALTRWQYYSNVSNYTKKYNNNAVTWWMRSPYKTSTSSVWVYSSSYVWDIKQANINCYVSPCFCLAKTPPTPPDFSTDSWSDIQAYIDEYGTNGFADQVGATRDITLSDNTTNTLRLANATGNLYELADGSGYTGFVVEFLKYTQNTYFSSSASNVGALGTFDPISTTVLPAIKAKLPQDLRDIIATVKVLKANSTTDTTLVSSDMDLFLPAVYELTGKTWWGPATESQFTLWKYYEIHNTESDRGKDVSPSSGYWTRTPSQQTNNQMMDNISTSGYIGDSFVNQIKRAAVPCFCLAPTSTPPAPTPTSFADDDWATIKYAVDNNLASAVYSVGDTKTITLSDNTTHTLRIVNMTGNLYEYADNAGTYTGFVVEFMTSPWHPTGAFPDPNKRVWASNNSNTGPLGVVDPMGTTVLPEFQALLPQDLQNVLSTVKVVQAQSGTSGTLVSSDMKLFIPAEKELYPAGSYTMRSRQEERDALTGWQYYIDNTSAASHKKLDATSGAFWLRSPTNSKTNQVGYASMYDGNNSFDGVTSANYVYPCFCI